MWSLLSHPHFYWWSLWLFLDWQELKVCDFCLSLSTHISIDDLSDCPLTGRKNFGYVISADLLTFPLLISDCSLTCRTERYVISARPPKFPLLISLTVLTVPWLTEVNGMWSLLIHPHLYWWSLWLSLDWQDQLRVCDLCWSTHIAIGELSDRSLTGRHKYVISVLIHSHFYWWSLWLFLDWQEKKVCDLLIHSSFHCWSLWLFLDWQDSRVCDCCWSTHIAIGDLSDYSLTDRKKYVHSHFHCRSLWPVTILWLVGFKGIWSLHSHYHWWSDLCLDNDSSHLWSFCSSRKGK